MGSAQEMLENRKSVLCCSGFQELQTTSFRPDYSSG